MYILPLFQKTKTPLKILFLGAHSDDIEIGCGGTIIRLLDERDDVAVNWVVFSANTRRRAEAESSAKILLRNAARKDVIVEDFKESFFPYVGSGLKEFVETLKPLNPDVVFTHYRDDLHQDHRTISELTWNTFRNHLILEYEIVKYDGDMGQPNCFVHLSDEITSRKIDHLLKSFPSQSSHHWFTEETFRAIMRLRGVESNAPMKYAEAFHVRKAVIG